MLRIQKFLSEKTLAIVGISRSGKKFGNTLFKELNGMIYEDGKVKRVQKNDDFPMGLWIAIKAAREHFGMFLDPI
mgnify:CR=1 FL=1